MKRQTWFSRLTSCTNERWFSGVFFTLRLVVGLMFLGAGIDKFGDWSAAAYLNAASGPFDSFFHALAGNSIVDALNVWGLTLIGIALILGLCVRPASFFGAVLMIAYYLANFYVNTKLGLIDQHIILALIFCIFLSGGAGHIFGLDGLVHDNLRERSWFNEILFG